MNSGGPTLIGRVFLFWVLFSCECQTDRHLMLPLRVQQMPQLCLCWGGFYPAERKQFTIKFRLVEQVSVSPLVVLGIE